LKLLTHRSIRAKLTGLMMLVTTLMLVVLAGSIFAIEILAYRHALVDKVAALADVVVENSREALALNKRSQAEEILNTLSREPNLRAAFLFRNGEPYARYLRPGRGDRQTLPYQSCPLLDRATSTSAPEHLFSLRHLGYVLPIFMGHKQIGHLYLQSGLDDLYLKLLQLGAVVAVLLVLAVILSFLLAERLQGLVTTPILELADSMAEVSVSNDFSLRLQTSSLDETGDLIRGFNQMLSQLQLRDEQLDEHRHNLEQMVLERTEQLQRANRELLETIDKLDRARLEAVAASRAKSQFLANMSHEIRTPMIGVLGMTELLFGTGLNEKQRQLALTVFKSGEALLEILNDLLDFSKVEAGKLELVSQEFDLRETVEEVVGLMAEKSHAKGILLQVELDDRLPELLRGDAGRLRQIVLNLVGNAIKFTERGEVRVGVRQLESSGRQVLIEIDVEDTGVGIPEAALETIFDTFTQVDDSATRRHGGTGLGLAIVRQLTELMGGEVGVESRLGSGSRFWIRAPFVLSKLGNDPLSEMSGLLQGVPALVLEEDDDAAQRLLAKLLQAGLGAQRAASGQQALTLLRGSATGNCPFRFLLLDADMPGLGGWRLVEHIAAEPALEALRLIMLADHDSDNSLREQTGSRVSRWLYRPVRQSQLRKVLTEILAEEETPVGLMGSGEASRIAVLLVEDSETTCDYIRGVLADTAIDLRVVHDGEQALQTIASLPFRLVLMDCQMPVLDGFEATRRLREGGYRLPIVALTARAFAEDARLCLEAGMNDYLCKPFKQQDLLQILAKWLPEVQA